MLSHVQLFATPWTAACQASLSFTVSWSLLKLMSIESVIPSNHLIPCHPLLFLPLIFLSIRVFSSESALHIRWPKCWSFSFSVSPSNAYAALISSSIDWFDLFAVQGTLKSSPALQFESINSSALSLLYGPTFPYLTTGKIRALTIKTFVSAQNNKLLLNRSHQDFYEPFSNVHFTELEQIEHAVFKFL